MSKTLAYRCPHCDKAVELDAAQAGATVPCPHCGSPFRAEVPSARPIERDPRGRGHDVAIGSDERTIEVVHPAMFRQHPFQFLLLLAAVIVGVALLGMFVAGSTVLGLELGAVMIVGLAALVVPGVILLLWWIQTRAASLIVTNERTIFRRGILSRSTSEVRHEDVRNLQVNQNFVERLLGVGSVAISSAGQDDLEIRATGIPHPNRIAEIIRERQ